MVEEMFCKQWCFETANGSETWIITVGSDQWVCGMHVTEGVNGVKVHIWRERRGMGIRQ